MYTNSIIILYNINGQTGGTTKKRASGMFVKIVKENVFSVFIFG
jgi:hypothetical protein